MQAHSFLGCHRIISSIVFIVVYFLFLYFYNFIVILSFYIIFIARYINNYNYFILLGVFFILFLLFLCYYCYISPLFQNFLFSFIVIYKSSHFHHLYVIIQVIVASIYMMIWSVKRSFATHLIPRIAPQLRCSRNPPNMRK